MTSDNVTAAKAIRAELRALAKTDDRFIGTKISVTAGRASLMSEVTVRVTGYADGACPTPVDRLARELARYLARDVWAVVEKHWQADGRHRFADVYVNGVSFWDI